MLTVLGWWVYGGLRVLGIALFSWAENLVLHGGSCWRKSGFGLWNGVSGTCRRNGECGIGCDWGCYHSARNNGNIHELKGNMSCCSGWMKSMRCCF